MHARCTTGTDQGEVTGIITTLNGHAADTTNHAQVNQGNDTDGRALDTDTQRFGNFTADRIDRGLSI
ncbi:hypothetical protein D3C76_649570 [compost metagenome]